MAQLIDSLQKMEDGANDEILSPENTVLKYWVWRLLLQKRYQL